MRPSRAALLLAIAAAALATGPGRQSHAGAEQAMNDVQTGPAESEKTIGTARMTKDRTLILDLRAEGPKGERGDARLVVAPTDPRYPGMLEHIGGLKPGEVKAVKPFP